MKTPGSRSAAYPERRAHLLQAATVCFAERGFHQTSMREVCAAAGMSPGSVYRYFASKEDIVAAMIEEDRRVWEAVFAQITPELSLEETLRLLLRESMRELESNGFLALSIEILAEAVRNPRIRDMMAGHYTLFTERIAGVLRHGQRGGSLRTGVKPETVARLLIATYDGFLVRRLLEPEMNVRRVSQELVHFLLAGLRA